MIVIFKAIELLEVQNSNNIVSILVSWLKTTQGPRKNHDGEKYIIPRLSKRWSNPHNILDRKDSDTSRQNTTLVREQVVFIMWTSS